jgi:hypothetical protein
VTSVGSSAAWARARNLLLAVASTCLSTWLTPAPASADEALREARRTFEYTTPAKKHYLRVLLEETALAGLGLAYYYVKQRENSVDWALGYDWPSFREKLSCRACGFDDNHFDTNFITHPAAGTLYYLAARSNGLSVYEASGVAFGMSTLWEYVGEFRERVSINDMLVTPISGSVLGESTTQLGAFFDRSCPTGLNRVLGAVVGPARSAHDAVDGMKPLRDAGCDSHGFTTSGDHSFHFWLGAASLLGDRRERSTTEARLGLRTTIENLPSTRESGRGWLAFSDGNVSSLDLRLALVAGSISDFRIGSNVAPAGIEYRSASGPFVTGAGHELLFAALVGTEYAEHRRVASAGSLDHVFFIEFPASLLAYTLRQRAATLQLSVESGATFGGVSTYALADYRARHSDEDLPTVTHNQGYSDALGLAFAPRARLSLGGAELGVEARYDRFYGVRAFDPTRAAHGTASIFDRRDRAEAWFAFGPAAGFPRARLFADTYDRSGVVGDVRRSTHEVALGASVDALF